MSFILDALKKSENERQRQLGPSLADIPVRRVRDDRPWWAVAVAALLVVNLGVLLVVLLRDRNPPTAAEVPMAQPTPAVQQSPAATTQPAQRSAPANVDGMPATRSAAPRTNPAVQSLADAAGVSTSGSMESDLPYDPSIQSAAVVPAGPPVVRPITPPIVEPLPNGATFAARNRNGQIAAEEEMLPTHGSLIANGVRLPDMRLDIHVFSPRREERFVFVNMRKYTEGQTVSEGPLLERITADGAIMNSNGTRFLLPRQ